MGLHREDALACLDRAYRLPREEAAERQILLAEAICYALFDHTDAVRAGHGPQEQMNEAKAEFDQASERFNGAVEKASTDPFSQAARAFRGLF